MSRTVWTGLLAVALTGCVTTEQFQQQASKTDEEHNRAGKAETDLADARKQVADLKGKLAETQRQLGVAKNRIDYEAGAKEAVQSEKEAELASLKSNFDEVSSALKSELDEGVVQISQLKSRMTIDIVDKALFAASQSGLSEKGRQILDRVAAVLSNEKNKDIRIEGRTDDLPLASESRQKVSNNWELSTAKAAAVARYLQDKAGVDPKRLASAGFAAFWPPALNDSDASRALNRRIEIVLAPRE